MGKNLVKLMVDSGAFSVWSRGEKINLDSYIRFCADHQELLYSYVNLDVIPGQYGLKPTAHQVEAAAAAGWNNYRKMRKAGLSPIPVYHIGERRYWLERMVGEGAKYVGLGGLVGVRPSRREKFLDEVFTWLCSPKGYPPVKVHGFGVTAAPLIHRYNWFSTDSTSWISGSKQGSCYIPRQDHTGGFDFRAKPLQIKFAETKWGEADEGMVEKGVQHYVTLGQGMKEYIRKYLKTAGLKLEPIQQDYAYRCRLNAHFFRKTQEAHLGEPFKIRRHGFFHKVEQGVGVSEQPWKYRIVLVNSCSNCFNPALDAEKMYYRLHSFLDLEGREDIEQYVKTGIFKVREVKRRVNTKMKRKVLL